MNIDIPAGPEVTLRPEVETRAVGSLAGWLVELAQGGSAAAAEADQRLCDLAENSAPRCSQAEQDEVPRR